MDNHPTSIFARRYTPFLLSAALEAAKDHPYPSAHVYYLTKVWAALTDYILWDGSVNCDMLRGKIAEVEKALGSAEE